MQTKPSIAVVGMAGIFPNAADLDAFWDNIVNKVDSIGDIPAGRWVVPPAAMVDPAPKPDKAFATRAGLVKDFVFDPDGLSIDKDLVRELDPLYHIVLHAGRKAWSGCNTATIDLRRVGTILAAIALPTDTASAVTRKILGAAFAEKLSKKTFSAEPPAVTRNQSLSSRVTGFPAALLAKALGLGGGSYTLDATCASSLYSVKLACDELLAHRADAMLAGGVSRPESLYTQVGFSQLRALSPTGRCAPFDETADGLVVGEGAGILVLKRLEDARKDGDRIYGLIRGIGLANDLEGSLLSPDSEGQLRAMHNAYRAAGWQPGDVDLIECHGAGTPLGDRTELNSLRSLWGDAGWQPGQCAIGSIKSMIGHLLTAAGAAGLIKTLLAIAHGTLPPSLNFSNPPPESPLAGGPFRVQTSAQPWTPKIPGNPRRAAVSAFGFGGINAHLLLEEWQEKNTARPRRIHIPAPVQPEPIAIIGMDAAVGSLNSLREFQEAVLGGDTVFKKRPPDRWKGSDAIAEGSLRGGASWGAFMESFEIPMGAFNIPPGELPDIIPQHLLMLKVAAGAMKDAGLQLRQVRTDMSVLIGMGFDFEAANFHLRWSLYNNVERWAEKLGLDLSAAETARWLESLRNACSPPLTPARTLGALGGIIASRIARAFRLGGPSFVVSAEAASGLRALEIAVRALQQNEIYTALVGAVDFTGDVRSILTAHAIKPFSSQDSVRSFDQTADGTLPGEGAAALVLKRLTDAIADKNRIHAVVRGLGSAGNSRSQDVDCETYVQSLERTFRDADVSPGRISYLETHGSGNPCEDEIEAEALHRFFPRRAGNGADLCAVGSLKPVIGHLGAAAGLFSVVKTSLLLYQEMLPPLKNLSAPKSSLWHQGPFHFPVAPQYWLRNRSDGPRSACVGAITGDGNCMHVVLEEAPAPAVSPESRIEAPLRDAERKAPLGFGSCGLFTVTGGSRPELIKGLSRLEDHARKMLQDSRGIEEIARSWFQLAPPDPGAALAVSFVCADVSRLLSFVRDAGQTVQNNAPLNTIAPGAVRFSPEPLGPRAGLAFVYPGSGNHYAGMGRGIGVQWPEILRHMDAETGELKTQMRPHSLMPWRTNWQPGWESDAEQKIISDPLNMIFGQVVHGSLMTRLVRRFGIQPSAVIGYSLGESAGLFAMGAWPERAEMLRRMQATDLFSTELAGPCHAARKAWGIPRDESVDWCVAAVNRPADAVRRAIKKWPHVRLLIVNTPAECVIGGRKEQVASAIRALACEAVFLSGVVTVHCDAARPAAAAYRALHVFPVSPPDGVRFYSCALGRSFDLTSQSAADSILKQALDGFDFTGTVRQAYKDGIRIFVEMGPHASCSRMIRTILQGSPLLAASACVRGENETLTLLKLLGALTAERVPLDLARLYGPEAYPTGLRDAAVPPAAARLFTVTVGSPQPAPALPAVKTDAPETRTAMPHPPPTVPVPPAAPDHPYAQLMERQEINTALTADAHARFLDFSNKLQQEMAQTYELQTRVLEKMISLGITPPDGVVEVGLEKLPQQHPADEAAGKLPAEAAGKLQPNGVPPQKPAFSREMCLEFAIGSAARVLGPRFSIVDTYPVRVRLPDEPLMLVDRILSLEGEKGSLGPGRIVTEHDVRPGSWYLDGGRAPVCISVEAGQADLFLCAYLGIDLRVKGKRSYRLLDATVVFHRDLPRPGDVIRYDIRIEKFVRQGETYLFFFNFDGFIGASRLITMTGGCAGFFTPEEVKNSGGIIAAEEESRPQPRKSAPPVKALRAIGPKEIEQYDETAVQGLREGNPAACFGPDFTGVHFSESLRLPGGPMKLIDRVLSLDPAGGRFGLGSIQAEADIHPESWYLTCHFMDDMVMPGTLMYECCAHTLRVFLQRMGWVSDEPDARYEPVAGIKSVLKCRGPVTPQTQKVRYEVEIKEMGYNPEPYVLADAHMYADGHYIVRFTDMSLKLSGATREGLEAFWEPKKEETIAFDRNHILAFTTGKPSAAFGAAYKAFDEDRIIARLPAPPYSFIDRITRVEPPPWMLKPDGWITAEYGVPPDAWYFRADRSGLMPFCVLLEIALQPCGWLAAYAGSALKSENDLKFRNLGGEAVQHRAVLPGAGRLTMRVRMTQVAEAGEMIIEHFRFEVLQDNTRVYDGTTYFGFFTQTALARQVGIRDVEKSGFVPDPEALRMARTGILPDAAPLSPDDPHTDPAPPLAMPSRALRMIDAIDAYLPAGGDHGLGFIRGIKTIDPAEWFFKAHFYQDPVCPGSLGIESFLQLVKFMALARWGRLADSHRFVPILDQSHRWTYRGQILPQNKKVEVEAVVTHVGEIPYPRITANGLLKVDGIYIYQMENFGFDLLPKT
ncbi:MAG: beta-ketoacyl synthase N-terminal-like domain-containing protein [Desulfobacterales bacterium]|nr:beta-ketoacyl synthase N-terminal-like domain-containing protein [Desulfobacterales bacterium]